MNLQSYFGAYYMMGFQVDVNELKGNLVATVPGVPAGYEIQLAHLEGDTFRMKGGPADGSPITFTRNEAGEVTSAQIGHFELAKITPEKAATLPVIERLTAPLFDLTLEKETAFQQLFHSILETSTGDWIPYNLPYPKHEFVQYVMAKDTIIFHGSPKDDIDTFAPIRASVELYDKRGGGNLQAVYGTHDALWSMFFAVVDRSKLRGSIRNGVMYMHNQAGERLAVYNFSINQEQLIEKPWREGTLYFLPRDTFERQWLTDESPSNEWASREPVKPLGKLHLNPEDFPFLDQIGGHDDSILTKAQTLSETIRKAALSATLNGAHFTLTLPNTKEMTEALDGYIEIQRMMIPTAQLDIEMIDEQLKLIIDDLPPAYQQVMGEAYRELLEQ